MRNDETYHKIKKCHDLGFRIYVKPVDKYTYRIVVAKATKYSLNDIPRERRDSYEVVDGIVYKLKVGESVYRALPKPEEDKWYEKIPSLYEAIFDKIQSKKTSYPK